MSDPSDEPLIESWVLSLFEREARTVQLYEQETRRFGDWLGKPLLEATKQDVQRWIAECKTAHQPATIRTRFYAFRVFYKWAAEEGEIIVDPTDRITIKRGESKAPDPLNPDELRRLFRVCEGPGFMERRDMAIVRLFAASGVRAAEMIGFGVGDIDLPARIGHVRRGKGGKPRVVRFDAGTAAALDRYKRVRSKHRYASSDRLWLGRRGPLTVDAPPQILDRRAAQAGLPHIHPHQLRHTFAHLFLDNGGEEGDLKELGGWESDEVMRMYGRARKADRAHRAYDRVDPMSGI